MNTQRCESCVRSDNKCRHWLTNASGRRYQIKKQDILGWAITKLRKFRISKLPYFCNFGRELYSSSTSGFWNLYKWHSKRRQSHFKEAHLFSVTNTSTPLLFQILSLPALKIGTPGGAVGWGPALRARRLRVRFPMVSLEFFIDIILPAMWSTQFVTEMSTRNISWGGGKGGRCVGLTSLPPSCSDCPEIWDPQLSEKPQGVYGVCFTFRSENHVKWTNIVWTNCRTCNVQHVYVRLLPLSFRWINARTLH